MRNNKFWLAVCVGSAILIAINYYNFNKEEPFPIKNRITTKSDKQLHFIDEIKDYYKFNLLISRGAVFYNVSDSLKGKLMTLETFSTENVSIDLNKNFHYLNHKDDSYICIDRFIPFYFPPSAQKYPLSSKNLKTFKIFDFHKDYLIVLGEYENSDGFFDFGFYKLFAKEISDPIPLKIISSDKTSNGIKLSLVYNGYFSNDNNFINYTCDKVPYIYSFDKRQESVQVVKTIEKTPFPEIEERIGNNDTIYMYGRSKTFNTGMGAFSFGDTLFVASYRTVKNNQIILDLYSKSNGSYLKSEEVKTKNLSNRDIQYITSFNGGVYIIFRNQSIYSIK